MKCTYYVESAPFTTTLDVAKISRSTSVQRAVIVRRRLDTLTPIDQPVTIMASVDFVKVPIIEKALYKPPVKDVVDVLSKGLRSTFAEVTVEAVPCPNLTQKPFGLTSPGLSGNPKLIELGGPPYLLPLVNREKVYDLATFIRHQARSQGAFICGAGAGPWPYVGVNCEGIINLSLRNDVVDQGTRVVTVEPRGAPKGSAGYNVSRLLNNETRTALLGNYLLSDGAPGQVIKVLVKKRIGEANFITAIRETLKQHYGDKVVGLGGTFLLREGEVKHHVMPDFSCSEIHSDQEVDEWLHFFTVRAPLVHVGTLVTGDLGLDLRVQHFHGWGEHGQGGHYHYDVTPEVAHYEGYFTLADAVVRVDAPENTHAVGRD